VNRFIAFLLALAIAAIASCSQSAEDVLHRFVVSWNHHDAKALATLIKGATLGPDIQNEETWKRLPTIEISNIESSQVDGVTTAKFNLVVSMNGKETLRTTDTVTFAKEGDDLLIVPADPDKPLEAGIATMALMVADPNLFARQKEHANAAACASNLRQIGLALIMLAADHDGKLAIGTTEKEVHAALAGYLMKGDEIWTGPGLNGKTFSVNMNLAGKKVQDPTGPPLSPDAPQNAAISFSIPHPETVVLAYEGTDGRLGFWHSGKAAVVFLDGHCKLITPDDAKALIWNP